MNKLHNILLQIEEMMNTDLIDYKQSPRIHLFFYPPSYLSTLS